MIPRPIHKAPPKAIVFVQMWAKPGKRLWVYHNEEKMYFRSCSDARQWASKQGFDGVKFVCDE
jgi:hypothetical protein